MNLKTSIKGLDKVMRGISEMSDEALNNADKVTETYTRKMANEAGEMAPFKWGDLRSNVISSPHRLQRGVWQFGGTLAYARRQEYEHRTKKGFIRKAVWNNRTAYRERLREEIARFGK